MKKIYLLLTILTTVIIGLVFTSPTYAYFTVPTTEYDDVLSNVYEIDSIVLDYSDTTYDYWELELVSLSPFGPSPRTFFQLYDVPNIVDLNSMYISSLPASSAYYSGYVEFTTDPRMVEYFNLGDSDSLSNYLFDLENFILDTLYIYVSTFKDSYTYLQVENQVQLFINSLGYMQGFVQEKILTIMSYQNNQQAYENGYNSGYDKGYKEGYDYGEVNGENNGFNQGKIEGQNIGYIEGRNEYGFFNTSTNTWITALVYGDLRYTEGLNVDFDYFEWMRSALFLPAQVLAIEIWPGFQLGYFAFFTLLLGIVSFIFGLFGKGRK